MEELTGISNEIHKIFGGYDNEDKSRAEVNFFFRSMAFVCRFLFK